MYKESAKKLCNVYLYTCIALIFIINVCQGNLQDDLLGSTSISLLRYFKKPFRYDGQRTHLGTIF